MKKFLLFGMITVSSLALLGCQQQQPQTQTQSTSQVETSKASIEITEGDTATSKASLQIMPNTQEGEKMVKADASLENDMVEGTQEKKVEEKMTLDIKAN